jgi:transposase
MSVYVGMDVHRKRSQVALLDHDGTQLLNRNLPNDPAELVPVLGALAPGTPVAFEAAYGWGWLADLLEELDLEPHLVHPTRCKAIASARLKNDKVDARTLAHLLRADLLPEAWIAPPQVRDQRALLRHRAALVRTGTALKNRIHAVLADRGVRVPQRLWSKAGRAWLAELDLPPAPRVIIDDCVTVIDQLTPIIIRLERDLLAHARPDPRVQALMALPGIGRITAMTLVAEIGDITRFPSATPTAPSATATSPSKAPRRSASCSRRPPSGPRCARRSLASTPSAPPAAAATSPPSRSPASCWPAASTSSPRSTTTSTTTPPTTRRRRSPRRVRSRFRMCLQHGRSTD